MSISTFTPEEAIRSRQGPFEPADCTGCGGKKCAPIATVVDIGFYIADRAMTRLVLCEECGRDLANAIGFMCIRDGGWSKLEPRKKGKKA